MCSSNDTKTTWDFANIAGQTLLDLAIEEGLLDEVKQLATLGANCEHARYMASALYGGHVSIAEYLHTQACIFTSVELHLITNPDARKWYQARLHTAVKLTEEKNFHADGLRNVFERMGGVWSQFFTYEFKAPHLLALAELGDDALLQRYIDNGFIQKLPAPKRYKLLNAAARNNRMSTIKLLCTVDGIDINCSEQPYAETPLHIAAKLGNSDLVRFCLENNAAINKQDTMKRTAIFYVKTKKMLELFLAAKPNLFLRDIERRSVLHMMAVLADADCIARLLQVAATVVLISKKNIFGYTAADLAYLNHRQVHGDLLSGNVVSKFKAGDYRLIDIAQAYIFTNFRYYIRLLRRDVNMPGGGCYGFSTLFGHYSSRGMQDYYFAVLEAIASWDGDEERLSQPLVVPLPTVSDPHVPSYETLGQLIEQWLNDVIWAQHTNVIPNFSKYDQHHDEIYFGEAVPLKHRDKWCFRTAYRSSAVDYTNDLGSDMSYSKDELEEEFNLLAASPAHTQIKVTGSQHATSVYIGDDGRCVFYDPNVSYRLPAVANLRDAIKTIIDFQFVWLGKFENDARLPLQLLVSRFPQSTTGVYSPRLFTGTSSQNRYSPLHRAVMWDDMDALYRELLQDPSAASLRDRSGLTVYEMALLCNNTAALIGMQALMTKQVVSGRVLKDAIDAHANTAVISHLKHAERLDDFDTFIVAFESRNYTVLDAMLVDHAFDQAQVARIRESLDKFGDDNLVNYISTRHGAAVEKQQYKAKLDYYAHKKTPHTHSASMGR